MSSIFLILISDKAGRRRPTFVATVGCTLALMVVGILGFVNKTTPVRNLLIFTACVWAFFSRARTFAYYLFMLFPHPYCSHRTVTNSIAVGSIGWAFVGEVASQKLRARTAGVAAAASVVFGLTFNTTVPLMLNTSGASWGYKTAWLFFGTGVAMIVIIFFFVPEPSMRNSAEMDEMYEKRVPPRKMRKYVTDVQRASQASDAVTATV